MTEIPPFGDGIIKKIKMSVTFKEVLFWIINLFSNDWDSHERSHHGQRTLNSETYLGKEKVKINFEKHFS